MITTYKAVYKNLYTSENVVSVDVDGVFVVINFTPIPYSADALVTIYEDGEEVVTNRLAVIGELLADPSLYKSKLDGYFIITYNGDGTPGVFNIGRMGYDLDIGYVI